MLYLVHRVTISIKLRPVKLQQAVSESLPHKGLHTELLGVQLTCLDPVPASIRARNAQEINITNCDVTTWSWVNLVHPPCSSHSASSSSVFSLKDMVTGQSKQTFQLEPNSLNLRRAQFQNSYTSSQSSNSSMHGQGQYCQY